ncbi:hypothetical protein [Bradyrhizobium sp. 2S1]|uniref:hypothetical protein n=1 Tax=Bradyrhizobium sp. 2S1 TaxID=1404429 RepID=UPI00140A349D|nr:hypothetical protein [Bradyrhizobium sp. 2S1]MCK7673426.1 hypothetical protein [Bradyrhizobium sp. 2S1]
MSLTAAPVGKVPKLSEVVTVSGVPREPAADGWNGEIATFLNPAPFISAATASASSIVRHG